MTINRRKIRRSMGSRTTRRAGSKTKVMPAGKSGGKGAAPKFRYPRKIAERQARRMREMLAGGAK